MEMHLPFQADILVFLVVAAVMVPLSNRLRLNPVLGFLLAGVLLGPFGLGRLVASYPFLGNIVFEDIEGVSILAELGVIFLLFTIGLELSPQRLWSMRRMVFGLGTAQVVICSIVIGLIAWAWGNTGTAAIVIGCGLALSSTAVVMKILTDRQQFASPVGQASFSILLMQDLAVVPMIFMIAMLQQKGGDQSVTLSLVTALLKAGGVVGVILLAGRFIIRPLLRFLTASTHGPEFFMAQIFLIVLCAAWASGEAGLSMALGAFLAGLVLAETEFRNQVEIDVAPFRGLFLGLFFMSVGMGIDVFAVMDNLVWLGLAVLGLFAIKSSIITGLLYLFRTPMPTAVHTGMALGQGGEFAFVLFGLAMVAGILDTETGQFMMMVTSLTLMLAPFMFFIGGKAAQITIGRTYCDYDDVIEGYAKETTNHVVIAGFGRTGRAVAEVMEHNQIPYIGIDTDITDLDRLRQSGKPVFFGDASQEHVLRKAGGPKAKAIILALDDKIATRKAIQNIRRICPKVLIYARAQDENHANELRKLGVSDVVLETVEMSLQLAGRALQCFDYSAAAASRVLQAEREQKLLAS